MKNYSNQFADYTCVSVLTALDLLNTSLTGLPLSEVVERQKQFGFNQLQSTSRSWVFILLDQWQSPFLYLLLIVALISFFLQNHMEGGVIIAILLLNTLIGFFQEYRAEKTAHLLKNYLKATVKVIRDNKEVQVATKELVPGDVVVLYPGDIVAADMRIIKAQNLSVDESSLTGESVPITKNDDPLAETIQEAFAATNIAFIGTTVVSGKALGVVFAIGMQSSLGRIALLAQNATVRVSSFAKIIARFSRFIIYMMVISLAVIIGMHFIVKGSSINLLDLLLFASALTISVIPEALPIVMTFALSQGALRLARNKMIVKRLSAIEDLGNIEILCTDKTGTLTENKLILDHIRADNERELLCLATLSGGVTADSISKAKGFDSALYESLTIEEQDSLAGYHKVSEIPFDPARLRSVVLLRHSADYYVVVRGAYEGILPYCVGINEQERLAVREWIVQEGRQGSHVLMVAIKKVSGSVEKEYDLGAPGAEEQLTLLGMASFKDPIKKSALGAVKKAQDLGISLKVLSGDSKEVCAAVAHQLGIIADKNMVISGAEFAAEKESKREELVYRYDVFSRVSPEHKLQIIRLLQKKHDVGYMGDGMNDVLALKEAHVGLAVQDSVDIAREAADIILLKKSLMVIIEGIGEGRRVFSNTLKYLRISLSIGFGNFYSIGVAALFLDFLPLLPVQILLSNFLTDLPMIALATDTVPREELRRPVSYDVKNILMLAVCLGLISSLFDFVYFAKFFGTQPAQLQTGWFVMSVITQMLFIFSIRTSTLFFQGGWPSGQLIGASIVSVVVAYLLPRTAFGQEFFSFVALPGISIVWIGAIALAYFCVTETVKNVYYYVTKIKN